MISVWLGCWDNAAREQVARAICSPVATGTPKTAAAEPDAGLNTIPWRCQCCDRCRGLYIAADSDAGRAARSLSSGPNTFHHHQLVANFSFGISPNRNIAALI